MDLRKRLGSIGLEVHGGHEVNDSHLGDQEKYE